MSNRTTRTGRVVWLIGWLARPFLFALRPGYRAGRDGIKALREIPADVASKTLTLLPPDKIDSRGVAERPALEQTRARTRSLARLFAVLLAVDLILWSRTVFVTGSGVFTPSSVTKLAIAVVLASQFLILALTNWQARTGRAGGFRAFLADGRNIWPR